MGGHHRTPDLISSRRLTGAVVLVLTVASATLGLSAGRAGATPQDDLLASETAQAAKLTLQIAANSTRADILDERYLQARHAVGVANKRVSATKAQIAATQATAERLQAQLGGRAALLYMGAGTQDPIDVNVSSVQELGAMTTYGAAAAQQDERLLQVVEVTRERLDRQRSDLQGQLAAAQDRQHAADAARRRVEAANASMTHLLDTTNASIKLLATQMEQKAAADAAAEEELWLKHQAELQAAHPKVGVAPGSNGGTGTPGAVDPGNGADAGPLPAPTAGAWLAVSYARRQLGKPYVYTGAGPDVFDCSGLTMMAWLQAGVSMEHGSQSQYDSFPHIPIDQLRPGDLVFFGDSGPTNHHVGMVVGPGVMIDAPHTGAYVELVSYFRPDLVPMGARP